MSLRNLVNLPLIVSKSKVFPQSYSIFGNDLVLSLTPIKATFGFKKDYISVTKPGMLMLEFSPLERNSSTNVRIS